MGLFSWFTSKASELARTVWGDRNEGEEDEGNQGEHEDRASQSTQSPTKKLRVPVLVLSRQSSMFFDADGDLAHEFYEENCEGRMQRVRFNLTPQGSVPLPHPALNSQLDIVMCSASELSSPR